MSTSQPPANELLNQIIFAMENQNESFVLDVGRSAVIPATRKDDDADPDRYEPIPEWGPVHGYKLMERFVQTLRNPVFRERLRSILASGRGVFRQFKNTVAERADIERLWLSFKQREMQNLVREWLGEIREVRGLAPLELSEIEDTESLVESDFLFAFDDNPDSSKLAILDRAAFDETQPERPEELRDLLHDLSRSGPSVPPAVFHTVTARTPAGDEAGTLLAIQHQRGSTSVSVVRQIYVKPEFRGLGLASALLRHHMSRCIDDNVREVLVELHGTATRYADSLSDLGFAQESVTMNISTQRWFDENERV